MVFSIEYAHVGSETIVSVDPRFSKLCKSEIPQITIAISAMTSYIFETQRHYQQGLVTLAFPKPVVICRSSESVTIISVDSVKLNVILNKD